MKITNEKEETVFYWVYSPFGKQAMYFVTNMTK